MRAIVLAATALALSLPLASCDNGETAEGIYSLLGNPKQCRDPRGRFAKCQTCPDGTRIWVGAECPAPPPVTPPPPPGDIPSPSLDGAPAIPTTDFDINLALEPRPIPESSAPDILGAFRFACGAGQLRYDDPIVYPGQPGKSHLHQFFGATEADAYSTYPSLRADGDSTCNSTGVMDGTGNAANRSAYWMPAMLDGKGNVVRPDRVTIYYKRPPLNGPECTGPNAWGICVPIPNGLRFIFGYDMLTGQPPTGGTYFNCADNGSIQGTYPNIPAAIPNCRVGGRLIPTIAAPTCWDGKRLDSPNHRDHVSYRTGDDGKCPATHPYVIPRFQMSVSYTIKEGDDLTLWHLSSDEMHPELPAGSTFHSDYFEAWDPFVKAMWTNGCINLMLNCSAGNMGNGKGLKNAWKPTYRFEDGTYKPSSTIPDYLRLVPLASIPRS